MMFLLLKHRDLFMQLLKRDVLMRYKGSFLGIAWSIINPLIMLTIYTFVFSVVFQARWGTAAVGTNKTEYALLLFIGLIFHTIFSEVVTRAPGLVLGNPNYVTKVVFPLELLSIVSLFNALIHSIISIIILLLAMFFIAGQIHLTVVLLPLIYIPLCFFVLGISWFISSIGVFFRDTSYFINIVVQILFFVTPIFYPVTALPESFQPLMMLNPMTGVIENARAILFYGNLPDWVWFIKTLGISLVIMVLGYIWFKKTKKAFADVM
ncbi:ABC transporter permease [Paenibacillus sp. SM 69]|nr:ABC transporter permease [Paenibacillus oleatilyticus]